MVYNINKARFKEKNPAWKGGLITKKCYNCGKHFKVHPYRTNAKFCSIKCWRKNQKTNKKVYVPHPRKINKIKKNCLICDKEYECYGDKKYCSRICSNKGSIGRPSKKKERFKNKCVICGKEFEVVKSRIKANTCSRKCYGEWRSKTILGDKHPLWKGGYDGSYVWSRSWRKVRKEIILRDDYTCQICGIKQEKCKNSLEVHHITSFMKCKSHEENNLITLCKSCHTKKHPEKIQALFDYYKNEQNTKNPNRTTV